MCSDKEFNWVWNSAEITPFDLDHFCTVKATKQNHVWVFFPRESFPVALSFCFWTTSRAYLPVWTTGSTHGENSIVILALIMTEVLTSKAEAIIRVADPAVFSHFIEKTVGLTPPLPPNTSYAPVFFHSSLVTSTYLIISKFMLSNILQVWVIVRMNSLKDADELLTFDKENGSSGVHQVQVYTASQQLDRRSSDTGLILLA